MATEIYRCKADFPGTCCICAGRIFVGDPIYHGTNSTSHLPSAAHDNCVVMHPEKALDLFDHDPSVGAHRHRMDSLRIKDDDGRIFHVCLDCGDREYERGAEA